MLYDYTHTLVKIDLIDIPALINDIKEYKNELLNNIEDITINSKDKNIEDICKQFNIKYKYNVYNKVFTISYTLNLKIDESEEDEYFDKIGDINSQIREIVMNYESFEFTGGFIIDKLDITTKIVTRAEKLDLLVFDRLSLFMDLDCVDELIPLDFYKLLDADNFNFAHDIVGIQKNLNRETRQLENFFSPRCKI